MLNLNCIPGKRLGLLVLMTVCTTLLFSVMLPGQSTVNTAALRGRVSDQAGAALSGATVTITKRANGRAVQIETSSDGMYSAGFLEPGDYSVRVEAKGLKTVEFSIVAPVGVVSAGNVQLEPGDGKVQGTVVSLYNTQPVVQSVLLADQIAVLPVNGRNYIDFIQLVPGVQLQDAGIIDPGKNGLSSFSFEGRFGRAARIQIDGVDISDETVGTTTQNISASAIQEFNLSQSTLDLSSGVTSTGAVNIASRSGGKTLHGEAFGSFRGDQGAASSPGTAKPNFQREQFGGRVGGTLIKDKLFWFLNAERTKEDFTAGEPFAAPFGALGATLSQPFREVLADGRLDWKGRKDAHAFYRFTFDELSQVRPFGAFSSLQDLKNSLHTPSHTFGYDFTTGPYTHSLRFEYLRMGDGVGDFTGTITAGPDNPIPGLGINIGAPVQGNCALSNGGAFCGGPSQFGPQVRMQSVYEAKYDGNRMMGTHLFRYGATLNRIQGGGFAASFTNPQVGTTGICLPGTASSNCVKSADPTAYAADFVSLGNGIGFSTPQSAFGYAGGGLGADYRIEAYVGDAWKYKRNLTLTYGVRYLRDTGRLDSNLGPLPALNRWGAGLGDAVQNPSKNIAPQFGFAWDPGGNGQTVVRGGAGLYFDSSLWSNMLPDSRARRPQGQFAYTPQVCSSGVASAFTWPGDPGGIGSTVAGGAGIVVAGTNQVQPTFCGGAISAVAGDILALSNAFKAAAAANGGSQPNTNFVGTSLNAANASGLDVFDPNYRSPRSWQMNFGFQHEFRPGTILSGDYVRNVGLHSLIVVDQNHSGAARSYNLINAEAARDRAQTANGCPTGYGQAVCMINSTIATGLPLGAAGAQAAYSAAGLDSNIAATGGAPCPTCAFPGTNPFGLNTGNVGALDMLEPVGRSVYAGYQFKLQQNIVRPVRAVKSANFQLAYSFSKFISQAQDQDVFSLATDNDNPLKYTGPNAMDRKHQITFGGTLELPFSARLSLIGHFYSPLPQDLRLPELTNGGEIFATDWLGSGLGSGAAPEPVPGTQLGQFMRATDNSNLHTVISNYNTHFAGTLTPAGHCLVGDQACPGSGAVTVMTQSDMNALGWVMPQIASVAPNAMNFLWLKTMDLKFAWPIKIKERFAVTPSASVFNVFNFSNSFLPGNLPSGSLMPGGPGGTLAPSAVGGVTGASLTPFRGNLQSGTYALGAPRQFEFGLRIEF